MSPVVKYLGDRNPFTGDPERDADVESDCEVDSSEVTNGFLEMERREEVLLRAVLTVGSLSAYVYSRLSIRFLSFPRLDQNNNFLGGSLYSSIVAQTKSRSPPSGLKVLTLARVTSARRRLRRLPRPAPRRAYTSWQIWCGDPQ